MDAETRKLLLYGGLAVGGYFVVTKLFSKAAGAVGDAFEAAGSSVGETLFNFFNPDPTGEMLFYMVNFPDGSRHSIGSREVSSTGIFTYALPGGQAKRWQMKINSTGKTKYAVPA